VLDLAMRQLTRRQRRFLVRQPVEQRKDALAATFFEANHHASHINSHA
jgi:hypothetical protein